MKKLNIFPYFSWRKTRRKFFQFYRKFLLQNPSQAGSWYDLCQGVSRKVARGDSGLRSGDDNRSSASAARLTTSRHASPRFASSTSGARVDEYHPGRSACGCADNEYVSGTVSALSVSASVGSVERRSVPRILGSSTCAWTAGKGRPGEPPRMSFEGKYNAKSPAVKRLMREAQELHEATEEYYASPLEDNLFEWHFTVQGPPSTDFEGGIYHGRILLPPEYPMKPPNIILLTPNGRFEINKKICLSISGHHPETWQPSWSIRTALLALIAFMPTPGSGTIGALDYSTEERQKLAKKSLNWQCDTCGKVVNLLSKNSVKRPITEEEQTMLKTIALKADDSPSSDVLFTDNTGNVSESEVRHRNVETISAENTDRQQPEIILNVETMSSSNDLFWSILIASLVSAIILLILRRLFLV